MRFILTSDIHIHNWSHNATINDKGINSRLYNTWQRINDVIDIGKIEKVDAWLNAGDLLHTKKIDGEVLDVAARAFADCPFPIYSIYGNHDLVSSIAEIGSARAFSGKIRYLDGLNGNYVRLADGTILLGISFHSSRDKLLRTLASFPEEDTKHSVLLLHQGLFGAQMAEGYIADQEDTLTTKDIIDRAGLVVCGHFHTPQYVDLVGDAFYKMSGTGEMNYIPYKSAIIPGALEQHNWGDTGQDRGCWILDTAKYTLKFIPLNSPKFIIADEKTDPKLLVGNFVKWIGKTEAKLDQAATVVRELPVELKPVQSHDYKLNLSDSFDKVLTEYVNHTPQAGFDNQRLLAEGKRLLCS